MANSATITITSDDTSGRLNDVFIHSNPQLALNNFRNYLKGVVGGSDSASYTVKINDGNAVAASKTVVVAAPSSGDIVKINNVSLTAGTDFTVNASDTVTATNLKAAINASANALISGLVTATSASNVVTITSTSVSKLGNSVTVECTGTGGLYPTGSGTLETVTVTVPSTAAATQADYFVLSNTSGTKVAFWLDIDAAGTAPSGAAYVAADSKIKVSIVTGGTAIQNGAILRAAATTILGYAAVNNGDATVTYTQTQVGNCTNAARHNADDSGNGTFSFSAAADGSASALVRLSGGVNDTSATSYAFQR